MQFYSWLASLYEFEINLNENLQKQFSYAEPLLKSLNEYLDPFLILNLWIPLIAGCKHKLLVQAVTIVGITNTFASLIKWCIPEHRPIWWIKENRDAFSKIYDEIYYDSESCDTSSGFPSSFVMASTAFMFILVSRFVKFVPYDNDLLTNAIVLVFSTLLWISRIYFFYEFLHQCIAGSILAFWLLYTLKPFTSELLTTTKSQGLYSILVFGVFVSTSSCLVMMCSGVDMLWSVRMAFKWCADPSYLKHETTPVFTLCRDFGYILGIALSCPLAKSYKDTADNYLKRVPILIVIESLNYLGILHTPKQHGRFIFVAYEFLRNSFHSFCLLTILPKLDKK